MLREGRVCKGEAKHGGRIGLVVRIDGVLCIVCDRDKTWSKTYVSSRHLVRE